MRKVALIVGVVVVLLIAAVLVVPRLIDWNAYKPEIASAVRDATGRELQIDGNLDIKIIPGAAFSASGIRLSNAPDAPKAEMVRIKSIDGKIALLPLLGGTLVVERLIVEEPEINLSVDKTGRPNWEMQPAKPSAQTSPPTKPAEKSEPPFKQIRLGDVRIVKGQLSYSDAVTGQNVSARDLDAALAMPELSQPLVSKISMILNEEPTTLDATVDTPQAVMSGRSATVKVALQSKRITLRLDGNAKQGTEAGMAGVLDLDVPSVGQLASWLGRPLDRPDPGALKLHSEFDAAPSAVTLKTATIQGAGLQATATGALEMADGAVRKMALKVDGGVLDVDRYLPKPARPAAVAPRQAPTARPSERKGAPGDIFAALSDKRFDLGPLRNMGCDVGINLQGIKAMGFEVGRIDTAMVMRGGKGTATIREIQLYGGRIAGEAKMDATGDALAVDSTLSVEKVDIGRLAKAASTAEPPVTGVVTAKLTAAGRGNSPRALAEAAVGHLDVDLGGADMRNAAAKVSALKLAVDLPGIDKAPTVKGSAVYNGQPVTVDVTGDATRKMLSADKFQLNATVASALANAHYTGSVLRSPTPGLDGTMDASVESVGRFLSWVGKPLGQGQPDPGALKLHAVMAGDAGKAALKEARIEGKAIRATAKGTFDASKTVPEFDASVNVEQADLNAYLPPEAKAPPKTPAPHPQQPAKSTGWSEEPIDTAALSQAKGKIEARFAAIRYRDLTVESGQAVASLGDGAFKAALDNVKLAQGTLAATTSLTPSGKGLALDYQASASGVQAQPLLVAFAGTDRLSGTLQFNAKGHATGASQKELVGNLNGDGAFKFLDGAIHGVNIPALLRQAKTLGFDASARETQKTDFAELSGTFTIRNGVLENKDLKMLAPLVRLAGEGTVPMPPRTVDYRVTATLVGSLEGQGGREGINGLPIPIRVTGGWDSPSYNVDWKSVFAEAAKDPARLKSMPKDLQEAAKGFGIQLPGLPGGGKLPDLRNVLPGAGGAQSQPPPAGGAQPPEKPDIGKSLRGLIGR
jgi:AsmA protein